MTRRRQDDVLTDYVRDRLDRLVSRAKDEADGWPIGEDHCTVVRPRPSLVADELPSSSHPEHQDRAGAVSLPQALARQDADVSHRGGPSADADGEKPHSALGVRFTRRHLMVVAAVLVLGILVAGYALTRARTVPVTVQTAVTSPEPVQAAASAAASPSAEPIRVHILGEVAAPGVHRLPPGARVADALDAADGLTDQARPGELNLAQPLTDGQQVIVGDQQRASEIRGGDGGQPVAPVGGQPDPGGAGVGGAGGPTGKLDLNSATAAQLDALPGVGPVTADKILAWRQHHGRFSRVEELQEVPGIGPKSFAEIAPHVTV